MIPESVTPQPDSSIVTECKNLPEDIADLAREIQATLAAEGPINQARADAERGNRDTYNTETAEGRAAFSFAEAAWSAIRVPAAERQRAANEKAGSVGEKALQDVRIERGHLLVAARAKVPEGQWEAWCKANVRRPNGVALSQRDIRATIALVKSGDPGAARKREKAQKRESVERHRERSGTTSAPVVPLAEAPPSEINSLTQRLTCRANAAINAITVVADKPVEPPAEYWKEAADKVVEPKVVEPAAVNGQPAVATDIVVQNNALFIKQVESLASRVMPSFEGGSGGDKIRAAWNAATLSARRRSLRALLNIEQPAAVKPDPRQIPLFTEPAAE
jgi:hypothetical protein